MSQFLHQGQAWQLAISLPEERSRQPLDRWWINSGENAQPWAYGKMWSRSRMVSGDPTQPLTMDSVCDDHTEFEAFPLELGGGQQQLKIRGTTYDSTGAALGSCGIDAFITAMDVKVGTCTSDAGGYYECPTPMVGVQHYLVAYKPGGPDVAGVTVNTITPS